MRFAGHISDWNDDRGFGFVRPLGGGDRAFVHIKSFESASRRPVEGDLISYATSTDGQGRLQASEIRFAAPQPKPRKVRDREKPKSHVLIAVVFLLAIFAGYYFGKLPTSVVIGYFGLSAFSFFQYGKDKGAAKLNDQRTWEDALHTVDVFGGWPGGLIGQWMFRHKTVKQQFQVMFWTTVILNIAGVIVLLATGVLGRPG